MECGVGRQPYKTLYFYPDTNTHLECPLKNSWGPAEPPSHWCRTFPPLLAKMGYGLLCGTEERNIEHVFLQCPIHQPPHGLHSLTILDDETIEWLLNTRPEV